MSHEPPNPFEVTIAMVSDIRTQLRLATEAAHAERDTHWKAEVERLKAELETIRAETRRETLEEAARAMSPMLRSMLSRGQAVRLIRALASPAPEGLYSCLCVHCHSSFESPNKRAVNCGCRATPPKEENK